MFKFIGNGSCFNTASGSNSAFIDCGDKKILFECGESVYARLNGTWFWDGIQEVHVFISHNHGDHMGSLGSLIFYAYWAKKVKMFVYGDHNLKTILTLQGVDEKYYVFNDMYEGTRKTYTIKPVLGAVSYQITPIKVIHDPRLENCCGFLVKEDASNKIFYYGGDARDIPELVLTKFKEGKITKMFLDVSWNDYPGNIHLSYKRVCEALDTRREDVYIMHLEQNFNTLKAKSDGFQIVELN